MKKILFIFLYFLPYCIEAQDVINKEVIEVKGLLLKSPIAQFEATAAVNDMYNFKFERAKNQFIWFQEKYPNHPMPDFLLGLNEWWKIMPNSDNPSNDETFLKYMDSSIDKAEKLYKQDKTNVEASFFLAAAYAFKSRLHGERKHWLRAASSGKSALNYLRRGNEQNDLSPELMFGDGLYNYYSIWIRDNYPSLKPILMFFKKGDKALGLKQLEDVANNAFYTRTEAQYFLMRIYSDEASEANKAQNYQLAQEYQTKRLATAEYLHKNFPDNAYFHRYYAGVVFSMALLEDAEKASKSILERIERKQIGYEGVSGRYASFILGYISRVRYGDLKKSEEYLKQTIGFAESTKSFDSGYYLGALQDLGNICHQRKDYKSAKEYYAKLKKYSKRKSNQRKDAKKHLREYRGMDFEE